MKSFVKKTAKTDQKFFDDFRLKNFLTILGWKIFSLIWMKNFFILFSLYTVHKHGIFNVYKITLYFCIDHKSEMSVPGELLIVFIIINKLFIIKLAY